MPPRKRSASETTGSNLPDDKNTTSLPPPAKQRSKRSKPKDESTIHPFHPYLIHKVNRLIEPGPVLLVTTGSLSEGTHNVMTIGFHMMMQHGAPTLIGVSIGPWDASYTTLKKRRECVLAIPSVELASTVVDVGNCSGSEVDKWSRFGLEAVEAGKVSAPLVGGEKIIANIECVVEDTKNGIEIFDVGVKGCCGVGEC